MFKPQNSILDKLNFFQNDVYLSYIKSQSCIQDKFRLCYDREIYCAYFICLNNLCSKITLANTSVYWLQGIHTLKRVQ